MRSARSAPEQLHHLDHARHAVLGERARHDRLLRVGQGHVEAPRVGHLGLDVVVGREGRGEVRRCCSRPSREADVLDEVGRVREARLAGPVVEDLEAGRARARSGRGRRRGRRAARRRGRRARTTTGRRRSRASTTSRGKRTRSPVAFERQAVLEQAPAHLRAADLHPDLGQDALRLVDDPAGQLVAQDVQGRPHQGSHRLGQDGRCRQRTLRRTGR